MARINQYLAPITAILSNAYASPIASGNVAAGPTVTIGPGVVVGLQTSVVSASTATSSAYNYLGIPFAQLPAGTRRFAPPVIPTAWSTPLQATKLGPACYEQFNSPTAQFVQKTFKNPRGPPLEQSEDCLYLNVYAPTDASATNKKAVMFWIYGGDLQFESGSLLTYNGSVFAGFQDVVLVTFNYRTNIFGFSNSPQIPVGQQNSGFLDQRLALQWVQDNIVQFGGDPAQVTIFGQSAGGWSVKQLLAQPPTPLLYRAAIMESEASMFTGSAIANYNQVLAHFGCGSSPAPLTCIQQVSGESIVTYISTNALDFAPANDHVTSSSDVRTNAEEGRVFAAAAGLDQPNLPITSQQVVSTLLPNLTDAQNATLKVYSSLVNNTYLFASAFITDIQFTCPASILSNCAASHGYNVWRYFYNTTFPNESSFPNAGAYHSSEISQVFGTYSSYGSAATRQEKLSAYMQKTWADFAKDPSNGPAVRQGWPKLDGSGKGMELWELGGPVNPTGGSLVDLSVADYACGVLGPIVSFVGV